MVDTCPACGSDGVHRSRFRGWLERLRWRYTAQVPFRCHDCNWRGWSAAPVGRPHRDRLADEAADRLPRRTVTDEEIDQLDDGAPGSLT